MHAHFLRHCTLLITVLPGVVLPAYAQQPPVAPQPVEGGNLPAVTETFEATSAHCVVAFVKGDAVHLSGPNDSHALPIEKGKIIPFQGVVQTGDNGFISLRFSPSVWVNVQPESRIRFTRVDCTHPDGSCNVSVSIEYGEVAGGPDDKPSPAKFTIETPYSAAAVRGPSFDLSSALEAYSSDSKPWPRIGVDQPDVE